MTKCKCKCKCKKTNKNDKNTKKCKLTVSKILIKKQNIKIKITLIDTDRNKWILQK